MSESAGTLELIARHLALALRPLLEGLSDLPHFKRLMYRLGWSVADLPPQFTALSMAVKTAVAKLETLSEDPSEDDLADLLQTIRQAYGAIQGIAVAPSGVDASAFLEEIGERLSELLLTDYLAREVPRLYNLLLILNVIKLEHQAAASNRASFLRVHLEWSAIPQILSHPQDLPKVVYGWGTPDLNTQQLIDHLSELFFAIGLPVNVEAPDVALTGKYAGLHEPGMNAARSLLIPFWFGTLAGQRLQAAVALRDLPAVGSALPGLVIEPQIPSQFPIDFPLSETTTLRLVPGTNAGSLFGILIRPDDVSIKYPFAPGTQPPQGGVGVGFDYTSPKHVTLLGSDGATRLEAKGAALSVAARSVNGEFDVVLNAQPNGLNLVLSAEDLDGFLSELLGRSDRTIPVVLDVQWSNRTGFSFTGGAGFEISTHPHLSLGPIRVDRVDLAITSTFDAAGHGPDLKVRVGTALAGSIGPVTFSADGLGVALLLAFVEGNAGPFDIDYGFAPPKGLGIAVDAGPITGGGFLSFDKDKDRYSGALELSLFDIAVKAIGFVETKLPNGDPGYSFLILIGAEFRPIQLGLGFTLNGVGGLVALHRRLDVDAVWSGMLAGSVDNLLYAKDPIRDAPRIISELAILFPPARGHHVFAPTALLGWGTPTIIRAELAIVFEPPSPLRVTLLGLISSTVPSEELAIIKLHVAVLGKIDFARRQLAIDAKLYDSSIAGYALTGDMAARVTWGFPPSIVVALGGLNPHFEPPSGFPSMERLTLMLGSGDNPKLTCHAYFAITPNTLQFGARAELYAAAAGFNIRGLVGFDCLVQQFPLSFRADLEGDVALRRGDRVLASVHLNASMTGPVPYHVWGKASLSLWLFSVSVPFNVTFGPRLPQPLPSVNPWPMLQAAVEDLRNWTTLMPIAGFRAVTLRTSSGGNASGLLDPGGAVVLRQTIVPLNRRITRFGGGSPEGPDRYAVTTVTINSTSAPEVAGVTEYFAAAQFEDLSDTERLSRSSFERMDAGVSIGSGVLTAGASVGAKVEYETIILDAPWRRRAGVRYAVARDLQLLMLEQGAPLRIPSRSTGLNKFAVPTPSRVKLDDEVFVVASTADANVVPGFSTATTKGSALAALADHLKAHPEDREQLQVIPQSELLVTP